MQDLLTIFQSFTPGTTGIWTGVLMLAGWMVKEWRETRKLSLEDRLARREGYAKQVEMLTKENRELGIDLRKLRAEYDNYRILCHKENDQLRGMIIEQDDEIEGLKRKVADLSRRMPGEIP